MLKGLGFIKTTLFLPKMLNNIILSKLQHSPKGIYCYATSWESNSILQNWLLGRGHILCTLSKWSFYQKSMRCYPKSIKLLIHRKSDNRKWLAFTVGSGTLLSEHFVKGNTFPNTISCKQPITFLTILWEPLLWTLKHTKKQGSMNDYFSLLLYSVYFISICSLVWKYSGRISLPQKW